ncbi:MAG: hypothetical protein ACI4ML_04725 [Aristaeellaceae bacterium]
MQRLLALLMALCLLTAPALAEDSLIQRAAELAARMDALACEEGFLAIMTGSEDVLVTIRIWAEGNHDTPARLFRVDTTELSGSLAGVIGEGLSDAAMAEMNRRLPMSLPSLLCAHQGTVQLAAASICQVSEVFATQAQGSGMLMLLYEDAVPVMVAWRTENGAALMQATFLEDAALSSCTTAEQATTWLAEKGWPLTAEAVPLS